MHAQYFIILIKIHDCRFITIIDSSATSNFMARALVERKEYSTRKKLDAYNLVVVDENPLIAGNEKVNRKTKPLSIAI